MDLSDIDEDSSPIFVDEIINNIEIHDTVDTVGWLLIRYS